MIRNLSIFTLLLVSLFVAMLPASAADDKKGPRIKKCQDAAGKWHYGDSADEDCARSKVIELDTRGIQRKEIAAPLTEGEVVLVGAARVGVPFDRHPDRRPAPHVVGVLLKNRPLVLTHR